MCLCVFWHMRKKVRCWAATTLSNHTEVASGRESAVHRAARVAHTRENGSLQQVIRVCACVCECLRAFSQPAQAMAAMAMGRSCC